MIMPVEVTTKKSNRQEQELYLLNAHVALETGQPEKAQFYLNKLQSTRLPRKRQARYYFLKGKTAVLLQQYKTARADLERALALFESSEGSEPLDIERTRAWLGTIYYQEGHYREALEFYERCLETLKQGTIDDPNFHVLVYHNLASGYHLIGDNEKALACYRAAVELSEGLEANSELAALYWGMGLVYRSQNNLPMAKLYLDKSAGLYETLGYLKEAATVRGMVGLAMIQRKELEEAQKALSSALQIARRLQDAGALYSASINLAELHYVQRNFIQAEKYAGEALKQATTLADNFRLGQALAQLADAKLARSITEEGLALYEQSIKYLEQTDAVAYLAEVCFRFGNALENLNQYRRAFEMYRKAYLLKPATSRPVPVTID
jgi:tetratricopeptide (TPR) repeat protein